MMHLLLFFFDVILVTRYSEMKLFCETSEEQRNDGMGGWGTHHHASLISNNKSVRKWECTALGVLHKIHWD